MNLNRRREQGGGRFAPWTALLVLSLLAAIVLVAPGMVFAQITGQLSQECDFALVGNEHTITATVTEGGAPGASEPVFFIPQTPRIMANTCRCPALTRMAEPLSPTQLAV